MGSIRNPLDPLKDPIGVAKNPTEGLPFTMGSNTTVQAAAPVDPAKVGADSLATQLRLAPDVFASESTYRPEYAALDQQILNASVFGQPDISAYARTPTVQSAWANQQTDPNTASVYPDIESYARSYWQNVGRAAGDTMPTSGGLLDLYSQATPVLTGIQTQANTAQRAADIADVAALGGQAREAYLAANPDLARTMGTLDANIAAARGAAAPQASAGRLGAANTYDAATMSPTLAQDSLLTPRLTADAQSYARMSGLQSALERQAYGDLAAGGSLTASELANAQQSARSAYAARGLNDSGAAINAEILMTDQARQAKVDRAREFAAGVDASGQQQLNAGRTFALGVEDSLSNRSQFNATAANNASAFNATATNAARATNAAAQNQFALSQFSSDAEMARFNTGLQYQQGQDQFNREMTLANMYAGQAQDPYQLVLGRSGTPAASQNAASQASYALNSGPKIFDPFNSDIMQIYAGNQANTQAANIASANNSSAQGAATMGAVGTIGAAALIAF